MSAVTEAARAKVNLYLHILGLRPDRYHLLESLVGFTELADSLRFEPADRFSLEIDGPFAAELALAVPRAEDNIVYRATTAFAAYCGRRPEVQVRLTKNLPLAAGLGGGSADAAAVLRGLARLWRVSPDPAALPRLALALGADVLACLSSWPALMGGIGERLGAVEALPDCTILLANPGRPLATGAVFRQFDQGKSEPRDLAADSRRFDNFADLRQFLASRGNDLTSAASILEPAIIEVTAALAALPAATGARMSGSGSTCFALFENRGDAEAGAGELSRRHPDWWIEATGLHRPKLIEGRSR